MDSAAYSSGVFTSALTQGSGTGTYSMYGAFVCLISLALLVEEALRNASISSRPARSGCPCLPLFSGATPHRPRERARSNDERSRSRVAALKGGQSTGVIIAASQPRARTSCKPTCRELNCPRSGAGFRTSDAPFAETTGAMLSAFFPATTTTAFVNGRSAIIAAERNVSTAEAAVPGIAGGHGSNALSAPMRVDSPAARITPHRLDVLLIKKR